MPLPTALSGTPNPRKGGAARAAPPGDYTPAALSTIRLVDQRLVIGFAAGTDSEVQGMAGKSPLSASEEQRAALTVLASSRDRGEADRARAVLLTLAGWTSPPHRRGVRRARRHGSPVAQ